MKFIASCIYAHNSNFFTFFSYGLKHFPNFKDNYYKATSIYNREVPSDFRFDVLKYNSSTKTFSFIACPTFDYLNEPIVGDAYCINPATGTCKLIRGGNRVYHHKWQFVEKWYKGMNDDGTFNYKNSQKRSEVIEAIPGIKKVKNKIGNLNFWYDFLKANGVEI